MSEAKTIVVDTELIDTVHIWQLEPRMKYSTYSTVTIYDVCQSYHTENDQHSSSMPSQSRAFQLSFPIRIVVSWHTIRLEKFAVKPNRW